MATDTTVSDESRLLFGAGFVFGVAVTMVIMAVVTATVASRAGAPALSAEVVLTVGGGVVFAAIVGVSLWVLAFPENRMRLPLSSLGLPTDPTAGDGDADGGTEGAVEAGQADETGPSRPD